MPQASAAPDIDQTPLPSPRGLEAEARRAFLRKISHELRTPLNSVIGFAELLSQEPLGPLGAREYQDYIAIIGASGAKMLRMVNQIVEIMRLESQSADLDLRPEPLGVVVDEVVHALESEARGFGVRLVAEAADDMPWVMADARGLKTILHNLVQNALAHAPEGEEVAVRAFRRGEETVVFEVEDGGPGVDAEDAHRLLRPFEKGRDCGRGHDGAGLGLSIALLLARAMGGDLELRTDRDQGFTAAVALPAA
jgi:signal transduction histidine kinase